jgi:F-type H+-transporting ATPase subunit gamma
LLPFDFARFKVVPRSIPPITTLPPEQLLAELAEEYVYAELCEEVMLSFAAEKRGAHGGDDRRAQQCRAQAR